MAIRRKEAAAQQAPGVVLAKLRPTTSFASACENADDGMRLKSRMNALAKRVAAAFVEADGPCGPLLETRQLMLDGDGGTAAPWLIVNPMSLIRVAAAKQPALARMLEGLRSDGKRPRVVFYMDEIKPGNVLHPDHGKTQACFYWTLMELPSWFRARAGGWFHYTTLPMKQVVRVAGRQSFIMARMLDSFFGADLPFNFHTGFPCPGSEGSFVFAAVPGAVLADEKALKEIFCLKGASGTKPCFQCSNVVGHMPPNVVAHGLVHVSCPHPERFKEHTAESFKLMVGRLHEARARRQQLQSLGQVYGLSHEPRGLPWDAVWQDLLNPCSHAMWDWMHVLVASGGVCQYESNEFVYALHLQGLTHACLDDLASKICWPREQHGLPAFFFRDRFVMDVGCHVKAMAAEVLCLLTVFYYLIELVLKPGGILPEHCRCMTLMVRIVEICSSQENALACLPELQGAVEEHGLLFSKLYPQAAKPKFHWLFHIPGVFRRFGANVSCFAPERKHKLVKSICAHAFGSGLQKNVTTRILYTDLENLMSRPCQPFLLCEPVREVKMAGAAQMLPRLFPDFQEVKTACRLQMPTGCVSPSDLVVLPRTKMLVRAKTFLQIQSLGGHTSHAMHAEILQHEEGPVFADAGGDVLLQCQSDWYTVPFCRREGNKIHVRVPRCHLP
jgi:hypothetical protein